MLRPWLRTRTSRLACSIAAQASSCSCPNATTSPDSLAQVLVSENVAEAIRKELRRQYGHWVETARSLGWSASRCSALRLAGLLILSR
jgi:hypothetical protein